MATTTTSTTSTPCYVFRLVSFDEEGNKMQKRKYGFTAKNTDASQLDENVFNGIIARAEQTFNLRPSSYSLYLVLGPGPYATELGETDLHLDDYPALSSHSWTALHTYNQFHHKRNQIAGLTADKKGRKVVNLCLIKATLHNVAKARKLKLDKGKGREKVKEEHKAMDASSASGDAISSTSSPVDVASVTAAPPTPPKDAAEEDDAQIKQENDTTTDKRSSSPGVQDVADLVARFANFIAPLPTAPTSTGEVATSGYHPGMEFIKRAADFIAPPPVSTPPSASKIPFFGSNFSPNSLLEEANQLGIAPPCAYVSGWTKHASSYLPESLDAAKSSDSTPGIHSYKPYVPPSRRQTSPNPAKGQSPADKAMKDALVSAQRAQLRAQKYKKDALLKAQKAKFEADTMAKLDALASYPFAGKINTPPAPTSSRGYDDILTAGEIAHAFNSVSCGPAESPHCAPPSGTSSTAPSASSNPESANKYASLKSSFDKFVSDFNANLADAFGGPVPEIVPTLPSKTASNGDKEGEVEKKEDATLHEAKGEKENPTVQASKRGNSGLPAHNATCDVCDRWIVGVRYKCFTCPDWDCCAKCYAQIDRLHPGHALAALHEPNDLIRRREGHSAFSNSSSEVNPTARHFAIHCDGCNKPISGIRYKCAHPSCPDFDLCATCEADPISYTSNRKIGNHSYRDHLLVKIRKPIAVAGATGPFGRFSSGANVHANWVQLDRAIDSIRKAFPTDTSSPTNSSTFSNTASVQPAASPKVEDVPAMNTSTTRKTAGKDEKTWVIDVPLPFAIQGGQKDIHLSFDLGKNVKGETVILNNKNGESFDNIVMETILKEVKALSLNDKNEDRSKKATTVSDVEEVEEKAVPVTQESQMKDAGLEYDARWINDVTYNDGESVFPGTVFNKIWSVENTGSKNWPEGTRLICVSGFGKDLSSSNSSRKEISYSVKSATSGDKVNIVAEDIIAPEIAGKFMSYYRFVAPDGTRFGDRLWIDIIVDEGNAAINNSSTSAASSGSAMKKSDSSLDSSRIVTPILKVRGSSTNIASSSNSIIQDSGDTATVYSEAITSPRSTGSDLPDIDTMSSLDDEDAEDCDFVLLSDDDEYDQV